MPHHCIVKITYDHSKPPPLTELFTIIKTAEEREDEQGTAWFAFTKKAIGIQINRTSQILIIASKKDSSQEFFFAVAANVLQKTNRPPENDPANELYENPNQYESWWKLSNPHLLRLDSLDRIPGTSTSGKSASDSFGYKVTFSGWNFASTEPDFMSLVLNFSYYRQDFNNILLIMESVKRSEPPSHKPPKISNFPQIFYSYFNDLGIYYGVDFSGGWEENGGNSKIWIAKWDRTQNHISLISGFDINIRRNLLPAYISSRPGWWTIDFPFGIPASIANLININSHSDWWERCSLSVENPTQLRDNLRAIVQNNPPPPSWSQRRQVDIDNDTTWFPLFEQLYRQTILGGGEVLHSLHTQFQSNVAFLPWDTQEIKLKQKPTFVSEGFPGLIIQNILGLPKVGYKGEGPDHRVRRLQILSVLASDQIRMPITEEIRTIASHNEDGDAIDALVLVLASIISQKIGYNEWHNQLSRLINHGISVEGWFPNGIL
jgi:hypothetical protein